MYQYISQEISQLRESFNKLRQEIDDCIAGDGSRIDVDTLLRTAMPLSIADMIGRIEATLNMVELFKKDSGKNLIPVRLFSYLKDTSQKVRTNIDSVNQQFETARANGGITSISGENLDIHTPQGLQFSLINTMVSIFEPADELLDDTLNIHKLMSSKGFSDFSGLLDGWTSAIGKMKKEREETADIIKDVRNKSGLVEEAHSRIMNADSAIKKILTSAQESNTQKDNEINSIKAKIEQITVITQEAATLKANVAAYQAEFDSFSTTLETRNKNYDTARKRLDESIEFVSTSKNVIQERIKESEALLAGATNSALASGYNILLGKLEAKLDKAAIAFYISIGCMAVTCIPILDYFIPFLGIPKIHDTTGGMGGHGEIKDFIIRAILLLPTSWLTLFNAKKYANVFKLKEHYAYKYAIASSVEGFKKQAPEYEEAIAFAAFHELSFNPANDIDGKKAVAHHPIRNFAEEVLENMRNGLSKKKPDDSSDDVS